MIDLVYRDNGEVALLTLKRPPVNAFTPEGLLELTQTVRKLDRDEHVRAIVVSGDGPKFFSAGADLNAFADADSKVARLAAARFGAAFEALQNARAVVIAAINGYALGGGLECALATDIRIAEKHAQLGLPETAVGLLPCGCGTQTLPWLVGEGWAKRIILTGERVDAQTALRIGLVEEVVETGAAREAALRLADRVRSLSPDAVTYSKALIHQARQGVPRHAALALERARFVDLFDGPNQREGVNAFLEKRAARWSTMPEEPAR
ncbi:enoyl-CoA hydratase [Paraburkholderia solisilvae]|uniref:Short-chain-enoyl-CoA hydratase n=1 Tax=Paraburkholderia solisilvae TaxID=624376 RepID=A0A6J5E452_9BURK|nr:enoyl-CoA hydratase [Paraburkholderia solisilvae]CAB3760191.1 Short-chain-enoyl-CoA hydratase [Paraburkholderia solisilvae]